MTKKSTALVATGKITSLSQYAEKCLSELYIHPCLYDKNNNTALPTAFNLSRIVREDYLESKQLLQNFLGFSEEKLKIKFDNYLNKHELQQGEYLLVKERCENMYDLVSKLEPSSDEALVKYKCFMLKELKDKVNDTCRSLEANSIPKTYSEWYKDELTGLSADAIAKLELYLEQSRIVNETNDWLAKARLMISALETEL